MQPHLTQHHHYQQQYVGTQRTKKKKIPEILNIIFKKNSREIDLPVTYQHTIFFRLNLLNFSGTLVVGMEI